MSDVREDILARLFAVVSAIPNMRSAHRNNVDIPEDQLPAVIILDGDEEAATDNSTRPPTKPQVVTMTPGIVVQVQDDNVTLGSAITTFRQELLKLVLTDDQLIQLTGTNGSIRYLGCETDVGWTRTGFAALTARFAFKYPLKAWEL
jgi:hypothetical protein